MDVIHDIPGKKRLPPTLRPEKELKERDGKKIGSEEYPQEHQRLPLGEANFPDSEVNQKGYGNQPKTTGKNGHKVTYTLLLDD